MKRADVPEGLTEAILLGLAQGDYQRVASQFIDGFGLSQSSVSRRFTERTEEALREVTRPLRVVEPAIHVAEDFIVIGLPERFDHEDGVIGDESAGVHMLTTSAQRKKTK